MVGDLDLVPLDRAVQDVACDIGAPVLRTRDAWTVLPNRRYTGYLLTFALGFGVLMAYISASPFVVELVLGLSILDYSPRDRRQHPRARRLESPRRAAEHHHRAAAAAEGDPPQADRPDRGAGRTDRVRPAVPCRVSGGSVVDTAAHLRGQHDRRGTGQRRHDGHGTGAGHRRHGLGPDGGQHNSYSRDLSTLVGWPAPTPRRRWP